MSAETAYMLPFAENEPNTDLLEPFGGDRMIDVDEAQAIGMLACMQTGSSVDDDDSGNQVSKSDDYVNFTVEGMGESLDDPASLN